MDPLERLANLEGMDVMELLEHATFDSIVPGICEKCDYTVDLEPDGRGTCPECGGVVKSCLMWAGMI